MLHGLQCISCAINAVRMYLSVMHQVSVCLFNRNVHTIAISDKFAVGVLWDVLSDLVLCTYMYLPIRKRAPQSLPMEYGLRHHFYTNMHVMM